ncbi:NAD(P)-binding protein [Rhizophagus irregularis]|uniref:NAD(P)-binding protein n=1 Tax=Rhizophagus irregularis TaxID=588596 RepID=A0A2N0NXL2_9GLOM|nr:NAD(P)-binding protein [Rhizophagus irregularis]
MSNSQFKTVTIAGGTGTLGYAISEAFLNDGSYNVKILRRKPENENEKAKLLASKGAEIVYADYNQKDELVKALKGTDVLVSAVCFDKKTAVTGFYDIQSPLLAAAKEASVKRFIPSEFALVPGVHPVVDDKIKFREELEKSGLEYTYIQTGLFQEYLYWIGYDIVNKKATFFGDGNTKLYTTSLPDIGKYTVESLKIPETRNAQINVAGATLSLNEYLKKFEEVTGEYTVYLLFFRLKHECNQL